jgi:hypothetical protein
VYGKQPTTKEKQMSSTESRISITVKTPAGSLVTVRAESADELDNTVALSLESLRSAVTELEATARGAVAAPAQSATAVLANAFPGAQVVDTPPFSPAPIGGGRSCRHGKQTAIQGPSKEGGIYKGYFCPSPAGATDKCKTIYVNKHDPEWNTFVPDKIK